MSRVLTVAQLGPIAKDESRCELIGGRCIISPAGAIMARCGILGDEVIVCGCDLNDRAGIKTNRFDFAAHREPGSHSLITESRGAGTSVSPPLIF